MAIVGAGAAGLATAIFARRFVPSLRVSLLDTAKRPGAKILVSGGSRCNVTNTVVSDRDFWGGRRTIVRQILRALPVSETVAFFRELGVPLHEEADGKLFPDSNRARDVLDALLRESSARGVQLLADHRVLDVARAADGFTVSTARGDLQAAAVVLATGGRSLPKSGSDGAGYAVADVRFTAAFDVHTAKTGLPCPSRYGPRRTTPGSSRRSAAGRLDVLADPVPAALMKAPPTPLDEAVIEAGLRSLSAN